MEDFTHSKTQTQPPPPRLEMGLDALPVISPPNESMREQYGNHEQVG